MIDIKSLEILYFQSNKPVPYSLLCGKVVYINPIYVEDWGIFETCVEILKIEKNECGDEEALSMKYLEFLIKLMSENQDVLNKFLYIMKYSIGVEKISVEVKDGKKVIAVLDDLNFIQYYITSKDFDNIKKIILHQNIYDYDDRYIEPEIRKAINTYNKLKRKNQASPTLEMQKVFVISKTGISMEKINKMTYRTFSQVYKFNVKEDLYMSRNIIKASTKYDMKEDIVHPLFEKEIDIMDEIFIDSDSFKSKIESNNM
jgi:hypothetical protein